RTPDPVMSTEDRARCVAALDEMCAYLEALADDRRRHPAGDLLSELVHARSDGDSFTHTELVAQLVTLYMAGHEPVTSLIGAGTVALLRHPDQLALLRADPTLL